MFDKKISGLGKSLSESRNTVYNSSIFYNGQATAA